MMAPLAPAEGMMTLPAIWRDVERVSVLCLVSTPQGVDTGERQRSLCELARAAAADHSPVPVSIVGTGDSTLLDSKAVTLLVHASVQPLGGRDVMALSVRPFRNMTDDAGVTFGTPPRAVALGDGHDELAAVVRAMIADTVPWSTKTRTHQR